MGQSCSLERISGIRIGVNWSVVLNVELLAYGLAAGQFPAEVPWLQVDSWRWRQHNHHRVYPRQLHERASRFQLQVA